MTIHSFSDLIISITGIVLTVVLVFLAVVLFALYRRIRRILRSFEATSSAVEKIATITADDILEPLTVIGTVLKGIAQGIGSVSQIFKGGKDNE